MLSKIFGAFEQIAIYFNERPARLKERALEAADYYIRINETNKYKDQPVSQEKKEELLKHFKKQFKAWKDGI